MNTTAAGGAPVPPMSVMVCDDNAMLREVLCETVAAEPGFTDVGAAWDAGEAIRLARLHQPGLVVLDVRFPGGGARAARGIHECSPGTRILAFSAYGDGGAVEEMRRAGVRDYLIKGVANAEFLAALRRTGGAGAPS